jgi:hypothetical protein
VLICIESLLFDSDAPHSKVERDSLYGGGPFIVRVCNIGENCD